VVVLAQESRHIAEIWERKQRRTGPAKRDHMWISHPADAIEKDTLLTLKVGSIAQVTSMGDIMSPGYYFKTLVRFGHYTFI